MSSSPFAAGNKRCLQFVQCFSLSQRILKQDALEALAPPAQCSPSAGKQSSSSEAVGLCVLRVKYDLKSGLKFGQETRIFIARRKSRGSLSRSREKLAHTASDCPDTGQRSHQGPWEALARLGSPGLGGCPKLPAWTAETRDPCCIHCRTLFAFTPTEN